MVRWGDKKSEWRVYKVFTRPGGAITNHYQNINNALKSLKMHFNIKNAKHAYKKVCYEFSVYLKHI